MSGYGNSRHARRTKPMSKATQCAEALTDAFEITKQKSQFSIGRYTPHAEIVEIIRRFYPEEEGCTYQKDTESNSLRMIDEGRDV